MARVTSVVHVNTSSSRVLDIAVSNQVVASMVMGSSFAFLFYAEGVIAAEDCSDGSLDHAVLIAGYGIDPVSKKHYWLVRNSFSWAWGINGYALLERTPVGSTLEKDTCGLVSNSHKVFPQVSLADAMY